jgi:pyrimidine-nucleoside phosphorylase
MSDLTGARALAAEMIAIGEAAGRRVTAFVTDMDRPLGRCVGNALEVREAIEVLRGQPSDGRLTELVITVAAEMVRLGGVAASEGEARERVNDALRSGAGLAKLREIVEAQGGDASPLDNPDRLPTAPLTADVLSPLDGYVTDVEPMTVALTANRLGAGRARKGDPIDHAVGLEIFRTVGDEVRQGERLARVHYRSAAQHDEAVASLQSAFTIAPDRPESRRIVLDRASTAR